VKNYLTGINMSGAKFAYSGGSYAICHVFIATISIERSAISTLTKGLGGSAMMYRDETDEQADILKLCFFPGPRGGLSQMPIDGQGRMMIASAKCIYRSDYCTYFSSRMMVFMAIC
jgi:hypothetical protein